MVNELVIEQFNTLANELVLNLIMERSYRKGRENNLIPLPLMSSVQSLQLTPQLSTNISL